MHEKMTMYARLKVSRALVCTTLFSSLGSHSAISYAGDRGEVVLVRPGVAPAKVVAGASASPCEKFAAREMATYLEKMTGEKIDVADDDSIPDGTLIAIGQNELTRSVDVSDLDMEQYVLNVKPGVVSIVGGRKPPRPGAKVEARGTLYGVYEILEGLGVRWYRPEPWGEHVPKKSLITLKLGRTVSSQPVYEMRSTLAGGLTRFREMNDEILDWGYLWGARQKLNWDSGERPEYGGRTSYNFWHCYERYVPREYYSTHPEYFPLINGGRTLKPTQERWQLCLGNKDLQKLFAEKVVQFAKQNPDATSVSADPSDTWGWCECELCRAMDDPNDPPELRDPGNSEFNASNRVCTFNNIIARELARQVPGARLHWLAYSQQMRVPSVVDRLEPNTIIQFTTMTLVYTRLDWNDYSKRLHDSSSSINNGFLDLVRGWTALGPSATFTYEYWGGYAWPGPLPLTRMIADRVKSYPGLGIRGIYNETAPSWGPQGLDVYMTAKLLWNPNLDVESELNRYYKNYYGPAEKPMKTYHTALMDALEKHPLPVESGGQGMHLVFTSALITELGKCMEEARRQAKGAPLFERRLRGVWAGYEVGRRICEILTLKKKQGVPVNLAEGGSYLKCEEAEKKLRELEIWMRGVNLQDAVFDMKMNWKPTEDDRDMGASFGFYWRDQILRNAVFPALHEENLLKDF